MTRSSVARLAAPIGAILLLGCNNESDGKSNIEIQKSGVLEKHAPVAETGRDRFCIENPTIDHLDMKTVVELKQLMSHYGFCDENTGFENRVLDELVERGDSDSQFEKARRIWSNNDIQSRRAAISLLKKSAGAGNARAIEAMKDIAETGIF